MAHNKALQTDVRDDERAGRRMGMDGAAGARRVADAHTRTNSFSSSTLYMSGTAGGASALAARDV